MSQPIMVELFCGLGGASEGALAEGYRCIGFDIERHDYGSGGYPGELVLQDVLTIHGRQLKDAAYLWCSPPCQEFSYMSMPWKRAKQIAAALRGEQDGSGGRVEFPDGYRGSRTVEELTALFDACFRIQREASEAAGHHIPMVVENVKGAQPWVGRAKANYGSFYLWGDVRSVGGRIIPAHRVQFGACAVKALRGGKNGHVGGGSWFAIGSPGQTETGRNPVHELTGQKVPGMNFHEHEKTGRPGRSFQSAAVESSGVKVPGINLSDVGFNVAARNSLGDIPTPEGYRRSQEEKRQHIGHARKAASAAIAKIPFGLANYIARCFKPDAQERVA